MPGMRLEIGRDNIGSGWMKFMYERWTKHMGGSANRRDRSISQLPNIFIKWGDCAN